MIKVFDKYGNELESTYPKRANGLVKKGRARFSGENTIVLLETTEKTEACPPCNIEKVDMNMFDNHHDSFNSINTYFGEILDTRVPSTSVCGSIVGSIIVAGDGKNAALPAFDGRVDTAASLGRNRGEAVEHWLGLKMYEPTAVTTVMVATQYRKQHRIYGSYFQGSYDGKLWTTLCEFTEEDFLDYAASDANYFVKRIDCPVDYVYYRWFNYDDKGGNISSLLLFGEDDRTSTVDTYYGEICLTGVRNQTRCGSVEGMIIGAGAKSEGAYLNAFDGRLNTASELGINPGDRVYHWLGIKTDEPTALRSIVLATPNGKRRHAIRNSYFQGSVDGVNWVTLAYFGDEDYIAYTDDTDRNYYTVPVTDENAYTYFRYFNSEGVGVNCLSELYFFRAGEEQNTLDTYCGEIAYTGIRCECGSVSGEVIGAGAGSKFDYVNAFDGNIRTQTDLPMNLGDRVYYWFGVKADEPTSLAGVTVATQNGERRHAIRGSYFQGSVDGVNWVTLCTFTAEDYLKYQNSGNRYYTKEVTDPTPYTYFRYFNYNDGGGNRLAQFLLYTAADISKIQHLDANTETNPVRVRVPDVDVRVDIPRMGNTPNPPRKNEIEGADDVLRRYVEQQIENVSESLSHGVQELNRLFMSGGCTVEQYRERLNALREGSDHRMMELRQMLRDGTKEKHGSDSVRITEKTVRDISEEIKRAIEENFDGVDDLEDMIDEVRNEMEGIRGEMESVIEEIKEEVKVALEEALGEIRSLFQ